jgi:hypothetical protein
MMDGKLESIISDRQEIEALAGMDMHGSIPPRGQQHAPQNGAANGKAKHSGQIQIPGTAVMSPTMV